MSLLLTSPYPDVPLVRRSIFTHLLGTSPDAPGLVGGFPAASPAFIDAATGSVLTRAEVRSYALQLAYSLHNLPAPLAASPRPTSPPTVLIFSPNNIAWPILLHGTAAAGLRATFVNSACTAAEFAYQYTRAGAYLVFAYPTLVPIVQNALQTLGCTDAEIRARLILVTSCFFTGIHDYTSTELAYFIRLDALFGRGARSHEVNFDGERSNETLYLCYSSGTTGKPKGVETTHYNLTSFIEIARAAWPKTTPALPKADDHRPDVFLGSLPYYHGYGAIKLLLFPLSFGTPAIIMAGFDPVRFCEAVQQYKATFVLVVPPMLVVLARHEAIDKYDLTSIRAIYSAAAPMGADLIMTMQKRLQDAGGNAVVSQAYGLTETSLTVTLLHPDDATAHVGSVGRVISNLEVRLVRDDAGEAITDIVNAGEVWVRGPTIMKGYLNDPAATASAITPDGWFKTGDIAISDAEGFLTIIDRRKELIKYKAIPPAELEALLLQHESVADAAVVGVDDKEEETELPRAYIVPTQPIPPREMAAFALDVQAWVAGRVAAYKKLRGGIVVVDQIPKSASGKILRRELRERGRGEVGHGQVMPRTKL